MSDTRTVHVFDANRVYTHTLELGPKDGRPRNSTYHDLPEIPEGKYAVHELQGWKIVEEYPWPVPQTVSRRQAKQELAARGLLDQVQPAIDAIEDAERRVLVQIYWDDAQYFDRDEQELLDIAEALGVVDQLPDLYRSAAQR